MDIYTQLVLLWSAVWPSDYSTSFLDIVQALIGAFIPAMTYSRFKLTTRVYVLILVHCITLMIGGHCSYANVPLFDWLGDYLSLERKREHPLTEAPILF